MNIDTNISDFFEAGGTLPANSPSYVKRPADDELFHLALAGKFCYVLTARQMGKSSLMIRTSQRLQEEGASTAKIDLTKLGTGITAEQWYLGLITRLKRQLNLSVDTEDWWNQHASLSAVQCFTDFLHDVVLAEIEVPVVIFIDEIDTTLNLDFTDDFFAAIRFTYNARAADPAWNRLTFVLLGVATPADLIKDRSRTPFNIGQGVDLREFSQEDARILQEGLEAFHSGQGEAIFARIFYWTNGHPYLSQKLCLTVAEIEDGDWTDERIDDLVRRLFLSEEARRETNLQSVRDSVISSPQQRRLLTLYRQVYEGKAVPEDERSLDQNRLKLFGLVRAEKGLLRVRNRIYRQVFNLEWIKTNTPIDWTRRIAVISTVLVVLLTAVFALSTARIAQQTTEARAQIFIDNFHNTTSADVRITSLAGLFALSGYEDQARQLFYEELSPADQLALFDLATPQTVGTQLTAVVRGLYTDLENSEQGNALLKAMANPLRKLDNPEAVILAAEIEQWLQGRKYYAQGEYQQAVSAFGAAISLNDQNPGTHFDQGLSYAALGELDPVLADFETVLSLNETWQGRVRQVVVNNNQVYTSLWSKREAHATLAALVPTPTPSPILSSTPTLTHTRTPYPMPVPLTPTVTRPPLTPTPSHTPTAKVSPPSTATPRADKYPPPTLLAPSDGTRFSSKSKVTLSWAWKRTLGFDEYFDVRVWREGAPHYGVSWTKEQSYEYDPRTKGNGKFFWSIVVIHGQNSQLLANLSLEAPPRTFVISEGGGGSGGGGGYPAP